MTYFYDYALGSIIDLDVYVGQEARLPCRLVAYCLPEAVVTKRRRSAYEVASKKWHTPTQAYLDWLQKRVACTLLATKIQAKKV